MCPAWLRLRWRRGGAAAGIAAVEELFPERRAQSRALHEFLNVRAGEQAPAPLLFVSGPPLSGKTEVVRAVAACSEAVTVYVDCRECSTPHHLFTSICEQLEQGGAAGACGRCTSVEKLTQRVARAAHMSFHIIIDSAERLLPPAEHTQLLPGFCRLPNLSRTNCGIVLVSSMKWEAFRDVLGSRPVYTVDFNEYTQSELRAIVGRDAPASVEVQQQQAWQELVNLTVTSYKNQYAFRLTELRLLVEQLWARYQKLDPALSLAQRSVQLRGQANQNLQASLPLALSASALAMAGGQWPVQSTGGAAGGKLDMDLPINSRYLLLAAYNAARPDHDRGLAGKGSRGTKRNRNFTEPQAFTLERLLAVYHQLREDLVHDEELSTALSSDVFVLVGSLLKQRLLCEAANETLNCPKFRCMMGDPLSDTIASNLGAPCPSHR